jgi:hypothetical protein
VLRAYCVAPVGSGLFEFTGSKSLKWRFTKAGENWFCLAGRWRPMPDGSGEAFTILTTDPGPDVAPYHDRARPRRLDDLARPDVSGSGVVATVTARQPIVAQVR